MTIPTDRVHQLSKAETEQFNESYNKHAAIKKAIQEAKQMGFLDDEITDLIKKQLEFGKALQSLRNKFSSNFFAYNIAEAEDGWSLFFANKERNVKYYIYEPLTTEGKQTVTRNLRTERPFLYSDYLDLRRKIIDKKKRQEWKNKISIECDKLLLEHLNIETAINLKSEKPLVITRHAYDRWKERIMGSSEPFDKKNTEEREIIYNNICKAFKSSKKVYQRHETEFYVHKDHQLFFVLKGNVVITLYLLQFGKFLPEVTKDVVTKQLAHIKKLKADQVQNKISRQWAVEKNEADILSLNTEIEETKNRLNFLTEEITRLETEKSRFMQEALKEDKNLEEQENLLFRNIPLSVTTEPIDYLCN